MPELPEVETICRGVAPILLARPIARVRVRRRDLRQPVPRDLEQRLTQRQAIKVTRRGKYMLVLLDSGDTLIVHFGMSGRMIITPPSPPRQLSTSQHHDHDHVLIEIAGGDTLVFNDARRFGLMILAPPGHVDTHPLLASLGPDPLAPSFSPAYAHALLARRSGPLKPVLLDQSLTAGIGNIYACEALHQARLSPLRPANTLTRKHVRCLVHAVKNVLEAAIDAGGSSLRDHRQPDGTLGYFQHNFSVYQREGHLCPHHCGNKIIRIAQAGRATFYCPLCQS